jgi:hypothetical protein
METGKETLPAEESKQAVKRVASRRARRQQSQVEAMNAQGLPPEIEPNIPYRIFH